MADDQRGVKRSRSCQTDEGDEQQDGKRPRVEKSEVDVDKLRVIPLVKAHFDELTDVLKSRANLSKKTGYFYAMDTIRQSKGYVLVDDNDYIQGFCSYWEHDLRRAAPTMILKRIQVFSPGNGVGSKFIQMLEKIAKDRLFYRIAVVEPRPASSGFFKKIGWSNYGHVICQRKCDAGNTKNPFTYAKVVGQMDPRGSIPKRKAADLKYREQREEQEWWDKTLNRNK